MNAVFKDEDIQNILLTEHYINQSDIGRVTEYMQKHEMSFVKALYALNLITKDILGQAVAESFHLPYADFDVHPPTVEQIIQVPEDIAQRFRIAFYKDSGSVVSLATDQPAGISSLNPFIALFPGKTLQLEYTHTESIDEALSRYRKSLGTRLTEIITQNQKVGSEVVKEIFLDALNVHASDIHIEPEENDVIIRYRVDGILYPVGHIQKSLYANIVNRIKVLANLRIDEHFAAQDGALRIMDADMQADMRVSIVPILHGEKIAIRVLSAYLETFSLQELGLSAQDQELLLEAAKKPFGMILVSGPTGSGKTTTLYALIAILNNTQVNITTIEDPIEYRVKGINQIQVNTATNLTFAEGLRSIVRQDPNIILVGEIRDVETAEISVNAALTGHLLLSSFHANDAATVVPRLLDIGIEPFLLASTLELIIAQRLVRKICESCRLSEEVSVQELSKKIPHISKYFNAHTTTLYRGKGCSACNGTGYKGRTAIFELIPITDAMEDLIIKNPSASHIASQAQSENRKTLFDDGIEKVKEGVTTLEELLRVALPPK